MPRIAAQEVYALSEESLPWAGMMGFEMIDIGKGNCRVRLPGKAEFLRPGRPCHCHLLDSTGAGRELSRW